MRRRVFVRMCSLGLLAAAIAFGVIAGSAGAATLTWHGPIHADPGGGGLASVSCPTARQCTAVDAHGREVTGRHGHLRAATIDPGGDLTGVSCPTRVQCTAVDTTGREITFAPRRPAAATSAIVDPAVMDNAINAISCPRTTQCTAVDRGGNEVTFNPRTPTAAAPTPTYLTAEEFVAIDCPTSTQCTATPIADAGRQYANDSVAITFDPKAPTNPTTTTVQAYVPGGASVAPLSGVSCPRASLCVTVDDAGVVGTFDPATDATATRSTIDPSAALTAVSCASALVCTAVDASGSSLRFAPRHPAGATLATITGAKGLTSVNCPSEMECIAVDGAGDAFVQAHHGGHRRGHQGRAADKHKHRGRHRR
jgi:hypothetical protein